MIRAIRSRLGVKLFLSYLLVLLVGVAVIFAATRISMPEAFNRHLGEGLGVGLGSSMQGGQGRGTGITLFQQFQASFNEALLLALLAAGIVAVAVSVLLSRRVIAPVRRMTAASQRIADGNYSERVESTGVDELGMLGGSFNLMAEKLEQIEVKRRQLIGDISHELRTPLTAIKGSMEGLMDGVLPAEPETYRQIHQEAERLARLVDDLQELSRVEGGAYALDLQPVELAGLIQVVFKRLSLQAEAKSIRLGMELPAGLPKTLADTDRLTQVLTNLVGNAVQYTGEGGRVMVTAQVEGQDLQVSVRDSGVGIPAEHIAHVFDRFYRVDRSRSRQSGGSGIGLTIAKHLVEAHGGSLRVESAGAGQGSTFTFTLKTSS